MKRALMAMMILGAGVFPGAADAYCPWNSHDLNDDTEISVVDVQCSILMVLAESGEGTETPSCFQGFSMDLDCDLSWTVVDVLFVIRHSLELPMDSVIDQDGDDCADVCQMDANENGIIDWQECTPEEQALNSDTPEVCDGIDNDCDGEVDEVFPVGESCFIGEGSCELVGQWECAFGGTEPQCAFDFPEQPVGCDDQNPCTFGDTCGADPDTGDWSCVGNDVICHSSLETCAEGHCLPYQIDIPVIESGSSYLVGSCEGCHYPELPSEPDIETLFGATPGHYVFIPYDFKIDQTEITNRQFVAFLNGLGITDDTVTNGCGGAHCFAHDENEYLDFDLGSGDEPDEWTFDEGTGEIPAHWVTWAGANAFCLSVGRRLCTDYEWELAAGGTVGFEFPWGEGAPKCSNDFASLPECDSWPEPVGSHPAGVSPYGLHDMAGGVSEYTETHYYSDYYCNGPNAVCDGLLPSDCVVNCFEQPPYTELWFNPQGMETGVARTIRSPVNYLPFFIAHQSDLRLPVSEDFLAPGAPTGGLDFPFARGIRCCADFP